MNLKEKQSSTTTTENTLYSRIVMSANHIFEIRIKPMKKQREKNHHACEMKL